MVADLLIPALETSTSNRSPTIERTSLASSVAPSGVPKSALIASARPLLRGCQRLTIPRPAQNGRSEPEPAPRPPRVLMPWRDQFPATRPSPAQFCLAVKPFRDPPNSDELEFSCHCLVHRPIATLQSAAAFVTTETIPSLAFRKAFLISGHQSPLLYPVPQFAPSTSWAPVLDKRFRFPKERGALFTEDLVVLFISIAILDFNPKVRNATLFG